jgi:L-lactate dehydrogenase complex protein LldG
VVAGAIVTAAREEMLRRVRDALGDAPREVDVPRAYRRAGAADREAVVSRFAERVAEYRATVRRVPAGEVRAAVAEACAERGARRLAAPADLPAEWRPDEVELLADGGDLAPSDLDALDGALTGCALGIAETGTLVLDGGARQGRRALSLVPDYHVCVIEGDQIVELVPEAVERLEPAARAGRPLTLVSGPSATSDIELSRVEGVHGPRTLHVVVAG